LVPGKSSRNVSSGEDLLTGIIGEGEKKKDLQGREWDVEVPGAFHFTYIKEDGAHKGLRLSEEKLYADGLPMVGALLKRGMISGEDLVKKLSA
jgi:hypothetical protein